MSETVVRIWCACPQARYADRGRPTVYDIGATRGHTLDFLLLSRDSGRLYVAELKYELEYDSYRYLTLTNTSQIAHHASTAFTKFRGVARDPAAFGVRCQGTPIEVDGAILVWGSITPEGRSAVMAETGIHDVLSVEAMVADLWAWRPEEWLQFVERYRTWSNELFGFLTGPGATTAAAVAEGERR